MQAPGVVADHMLHDGLARRYGALASDDRPAYELARASTNAALKRPEVAIHQQHARIADTVLQADQTTLDQLIAEAVTTFPTRAKRRTPSLIYGFGQDDNLLVFDFIAIGLGKVGLKRGLTIAADSAVIPRTLVDWWRS